MATYCMADGQYTLFAECAVRGWLAAILDYPHVKRQEEECIPLATALQHEIEHETCCISSLLEEFQILVNTAFIKCYLALSEASEREIVLMVSVLKAMSTEEALALLRRGILQDGKEEIDDFYARYQAATQR